MDTRVYLLVTVSFIVGIVELIIGGVLDLVALELGVTVGQAGLLTTIFALVFGISGPVLLFLTGHVDRKRVTQAALAVFFIGNLVVIFSNTYSLVLLSRIISAASGGLLAVLCLTLAAHITAPQYRGRAIGLVVMGISGAIVLGLPIGVSMGHAYGWRSPFVLVAVLTLILMASVSAFFGSIRTEPPAPLKQQLRALANRRIFTGQLTTFFFLAGHVTLFGYLTPFVISTMGFGGTLITVVYFVFGVAAVSGGGLAGISTDKFGPKRTLLTAIVLLSGCMLLIAHATAVPVLFWIVLVVWGVLSWAITPAMQSHLVRLSPETSSIQQSLNNAILHLGIAFGTSVGSLVVDRFSVERNAIVGTFLVLISLATALVTFQRSRAPSASASLL